MPEVSEKVLNDIYAHIANLQKRIEGVENNTAPTLPIYDSSNWPQDAVEGQVVIAAGDSGDTLWIFQNGTWQNVGGTPDVLSYGYISTSIKRSAATIYFNFNTILGSRPNGATDNNYYSQNFTCNIEIGDVLSLFYHNVSGSTRGLDFYTGIIQDLSSGSIENITNPGTTLSVADGLNAYYEMIHNSALAGSTFLDYTDPTHPSFISAGLYHISLNYNISFLA